MKIVTLEEAKETLSIDFNEKDNEIAGLVNSAESYLSIGTGLNFDYLSIPQDDPVMCLAKGYVLLKVYLDYYDLHSEIQDLRLTQMMKHLQICACGAIIC